MTARSQYPVLIIGGVRSGKSRLAEALAEEASDATGLPVCYLATAEPLDEEMAVRIRQHQARRPPGWSTVEEPVAAGSVIRRESPRHVILVECLTLLLSNWMRDPMDWDAFSARSADLTDAVRTSPHPVILVSNEVGLGVVPANVLARQYADWLGLLNQQVAAVCARAFLTVAGVPIPLPLPAPDGSAPAPGDASGLSLGDE
ncbi:MAG: bifunctional adenosylcobinamide kinase/adenosylcobinamide-phosphate guanylyltransferase [Clostridia bacterium]